MQQKQKQVWFVTRHITSHSYETETEKQGEAIGKTPGIFTD